MLKTPVVFILFNRPDLTQIVFNEIRKAQPKQLFVIADGPRYPEEWGKCQAARDFIKQVDWNCEVLTKFSDKNQGGPLTCSQGISWVFSQVDRAIILEDDCVPHPNFFIFCEMMLNLYADNEKVMHMTGNNFLFNQKKLAESYYFSKYASCWGWATWKRAWDRFDLHLKTWPVAQEKKILKEELNSVDEVKYWEYIFERVFNGKSVHWDYAWKYTCLYHKGLCITPSVNLVSNIGFREDSTHTKNTRSPLYNISSEPFDLKIIHPKKIVVDHDADSLMFKYRYCDDINKLGLSSSLEGKIQYFLKQKVKQLIESTPSDFKKNNRYELRNLKIKLKTIYDVMLSNFGKVSRQIYRPRFPNCENKEINLHLGCGSINHPDFINIDALNLPHIHFIRKIDNLKPFDDNSVQLIYASHCLEHFPIDRVPITLKEWHRVLKKGGVLRLSVPDFDLILNIYQDVNQDMESIIRTLMGGQDYAYNFHLCAFNENYLGKLLEDTGFKDIKKWSPGKDKMTSFDDWSARPILMAGKAYPISLNIEATK